MRPLGVGFRGRCGLKRRLRVLLVRLGVEVGCCCFASGTVGGRGGVWGLGSGGEGELGEGRGENGIKGEM